MKKLSAQHLQEKADHVRSLTQAREALETEINSFNTALAQIRAGVETALQVFNDTIEAAREWLEAVKDEAQQAFDERSERWQESDRGQNYQSWIEALDPSLEAVEIDFPEDVELSGDDPADMLEQVPDEPDSA